MELSTQFADDLRAAAEDGPLPAGTADSVSAIPLASSSPSTYAHSFASMSSVLAMMTRMMNSE